VAAVKRVNGLVPELVQYAPISMAPLFVASNAPSRRPVVAFIRSAPLVPRDVVDRSRWE